MSDQILAGIKVVELGHAIAAPFAACVLADFGAEVIKVERPGTGDHLRGLGPRKNDQPLWWKVAARNKRSLTLDFTKPEGTDILKQLVADCDVLIENFRPGVLEKYGLGWEEASKLNPGLVMVRISGFGQNTSMAKRPGFGRMADSMSGAAHLTGQAGGEPVHVGFSLADMLTGLMGGFGAVLSLFGRERTGLGECVDIALFEPLFRLIDWQVIVYDQLGIVPDRAGNAFPLPLEGVAAGVSRTTDGVWMSFSSATDTVLARLIGLVFGEEALAEERFRDAEGRRQHSNEIQTAVCDWIMTKTAEQVEREFEAADAVVARIFDMAAIWENETYKEREAIIRVDDPALGPVAMNGIVPKLTRRPGTVSHAGPDLGAHTDAVLSGIGIDGSEIERLREAGII